MKYLSFIATLLLQFLSSSCDELIAQVNEGLIKGKFMASKEGKLFTGFMGIPYAEPPLGPLRFKAPVPKSPWQGVKDATQPHASCPQRDIYRKTRQLFGTEDCLFLNVYTPKIAKPTSSSKLLPVMLFIHGGGFFADSAMTYKPETLIDRDVVLVVINYRLGALGFLTTGDEECPGNNGMKDQSLAIKWTKENIRVFGGDPEKITLFGESAGGASVSLHLLSPLSQNLFQAGISQSGVASTAWVFANRGEVLANSKKLARIFHCPTENSTGMVECLRKVKPMDIVSQDTKYVKWDGNLVMPFKPCIEPKHDGAFLTDHPHEIMKSGKVPPKPWMAGLNTEDGALTSSTLLANPYMLGDLNDEFNRLAPITLQYDKLIKNVDDVTGKIKRFYFGDEPITSDKQSELTKMFTDAWFMAPTDDMIRHYLKYVKAPVYYYFFGYRGALSLTALFGDPLIDYGVCHADELQYLFPIADVFFPHQMQQQDDLKMTKVLTTLWTNFAKTGEPTAEEEPLTPVEWTPVKSEDLECFFIGGPTNFNMTKGLYMDRVCFWRDIMNDFNFS